MQKSEFTHFHCLDKVKMQYKQSPQHGQLKKGYPVWLFDYYYYYYYHHLWMIDMEWLFSCRNNLRWYLSQYSAACTLVESRITEKVNMWWNIRNFTVYQLQIILVHHLHENIAPPRQNMQNITAQEPLRFSIFTKMHG